MIFTSMKMLYCVLVCLTWTATNAEHVPRRENYVLKSVDKHPESQFAIDESSDLDDRDVAPVETDIVPEAVQEVEAVVQGVKVSPQFLEAHYYSIYGDLHTAQSEDAFRPGHVTKTHSCGWVREVPENLRDVRYMRPVVPYFYKKYTEAYGIPVIGSEKVPDEALQRACYVLRFLLADIRLLREKYFRSYGRVAIMAVDENIAELPEYTFLPSIYNNKTRGLGAIHLAPVSSAAEENVLCYTDDEYRKEDILIREIALGIYELAAKYVVKDIEEMLEVMYDNALESGWWHNTYAQRSKEAYFGEGIQSFFGVNGHYDYVNTRTKLMEYDVYLYRLLERLFPCHNNYLKRCSRRGTENEQELRLDCYGGHMPNIFPLFF